jgi:tRNA-splicing ligase RtcB (3'-phosphate/5'-hydroxy nucleic acid ligase)
MNKEHKMMQWELNEGTRLAVKSWCRELDEGALRQARNLANHPVATGHVALMPDAHMGFGMPIGGVIACKDALIPNAVGVDIGCGMGAIRTSVSADSLSDPELLRRILHDLKERIPVGEGNSRRRPLPWRGFEEWLDSLGPAGSPPWMSDKGRELDARNLGTLGGGNHFIELQRSQDGELWLMLHSGSRNLGYRIANWYHREAVKLNASMGVELPDEQLAFLPLGHELGSGYARDMGFALAYAAENRRIMMEDLKRVVSERSPGIEFLEETSIHHNYAAPEPVDGEALWVHRKGATSARAGERGIIPGSMGTSSYIVEGLGNPESFQSCSHGAGRRLGRADACRRLSREECDASMAGIVHDHWKKSEIRGADEEKLLDLSEAPPAYKDIDAVIEAELDLVKPVVKLRPLAVVKG